MNAVWPKAIIDEMNTMVAFQYSFTPNEDTVLTLAASSLYRLHVNGDFVGYGPARGAHGYSRTDNYALGAYAGKPAVVTVEVFSANIHSYYTVKEQPFFAAEIKNGAKLLAEAADFTAYHITERVQRVPRFCLQRTFTENYRLSVNPTDFYMGIKAMGNRVDTDAVPGNKRIGRHVHYPTYEKIEGRPICAGRLEIDETADTNHPSIENKSPRLVYDGYEPGEWEEDAAAQICKFVYTDADAQFGCEQTYQTYTFSRTVTGFFALDVEVRAQTEIYIVFEEVLAQKDGKTFVDPFRGGCNNVIKYALAPGQYRLMNFEANSAQYANVVIAKGDVSVRHFSMVCYENPDAKKFSYDYGDADLNKIVDAAIHTFEQNAVDVLTDCPSRERAGWLCDSYFSSRSEALFTGDNLVEKSFLENYAMYEKQPWLVENMIPMCYPSDQLKGIYIPNWSMWYILELANYVRRTGDERMREISKGKVLGLVEFFKKYENEDGLLENLESWVFIEWSKCNDPECIAGVNYPSNMLWAAALKAADELYGMPELSKKAEQMRKVILAQSWTGTFFAENAVRDSEGKLKITQNLTETCQYYAFYFDVATPETHKALFERLLTEFGPKRDAEQVWPDVYPSNAIVGNYLRLEILLMYGYTDQVLSECRDFFLFMAETTGTLWEHSKLSCSLNHGFASMAAVYIDQCFKGKKDLRSV